MLVVTDILEELDTSIFMVEALLHMEDCSLNLILSESVKPHIRCRTVNDVSVNQNYVGSAFFVVMTINTAVF